MCELAGQTGKERGCWDEEGSGKRMTGMDSFSLHACREKESMLA